jgi:hypothetical protein
LTIEEGKQSERFSSPVVGDFFAPFPGQRSGKGGCQTRRHLFFQQRRVLQLCKVAELSNQLRPDRNKFMRRLSSIGSFYTVIKVKRNIAFESEFHQGELITWHEYQGDKCIPIPGVVVRQDEENVLIRTRVEGLLKEFAVHPEQLAHR